METKLAIIRDAGKNKHGQSLCLARCRCGAEKVLERSRVATGRVRSCGCLSRETVVSRWAAYREFAFPARLNETDGGCLEWAGAVDELGYGQLGYEGKSWRAHRLAYRLAHGPIPAGMFVLHSCDNRRCCNPEHLRLGTHADNMRDMVERGRRVGINAGAANGRAKLTLKQARAIRRLYSTGRWSQERLGARFGVSQWAISMIVRNQRYKE